MKLAEFLLARITEDEADARRVDESVEGLTWRDLNHTLAYCAAQRRIVELHRSALGSEVHKNGRWDAEAGAMVACRYWYCGTCDYDRDYGFTGGPSEGCETLRYLALPYADHPDYDESWRH